MSWSPLLPIGSRIRLPYIILLYLISNVALATQQHSNTTRFVSIDDCRTQRMNAMNGTSAAPDGWHIITYTQCLEECGIGFGTYPTWSVIQALTDWVLPLFLLLSNITYVKSASKEFTYLGINLGTQINWLSVISQLLANPIEYHYTLTSKLESGRLLKQRCDRIGCALRFSDIEKKSLTGVCFALQDFENGIHVEKLLPPLETHYFQAGLNQKSVDSRDIHWRAIRGEIELTARNLAGSRNHFKFYCVVAILVYGKDVFVALVQYKFDEDFPYHMPHTLALRQLYYWLFLAIILSSAVGGMTDQWSSQSFLSTLMRHRRENLNHEQANGVFYYEDIILEGLEPWNGGNYNWKYPKGEMTKRKFSLLMLVLAAIGLPVAIAFYMSWETPTTGLGDRGICELLFALLWIVNYVVNWLASKRWSGKKLFRLMWWNTFWSIASLYVLFGAFQGWYNSCESWSSHWSRGSNAFINLDMKAIIEQKIFTFYLPLAMLSLFAQLSIAAFILRLCRETMSFTLWSNEENRSFLERYQARDSSSVFLKSVDYFTTLSPSLPPDEVSGAPMRRKSGRAVGVNEEFSKVDLKSQEVEAIVV